jgi:hypothetical protein
MISSRISLKERMKPMRRINLVPMFPRGNMGTRLKNKLPFRFYWVSKDGEVIVE